MNRNRVTPSKVRKGDRLGNGSVVLSATPAYRRPGMTRLEAVTPEGRGWTKFYRSDLPMLVWR